MNKGLTCFVMFAIGAVAGSVATWQYAKTKYEQYAQEEIQAVKEVYHKKEAAFKETNNAEKEAYKEVYEEIANSYGRTDYSSTVIKKEEKQEVEVVEVDKAIEIFSPDEYGDIFDYTCIEFTYYADKVLADEMDEIVDDIENTIGLEALDSFGLYEDDSVHVRNDKRKCYYEILLDHRKYSDVMNRY